MPLRKQPPTRTLAEHPDISQLKRQAKELLKAFAAGDADAIAEVNTSCWKKDRRSTHGTIS